MADADYAFNRFVRAQVVIDALSRHWEKEERYPDKLDQLIAGDYLDEIPRPRVGFQFLYAPVGWLQPSEFFYRNVGASYVLEFVSTEWVQCAYNPAYTDDGLEDEELEEDYDYEGEYADEEGEVWSCPDAPPELW